MSTAFPSIPGYIGPLSLKTFFEEYLRLRLTFGIANAPATRNTANHARVAAAPLSRTPHPLDAPACPSSSFPLRDVVLPPTQSFLVVVYVAQHAPPPPPTAFVSESLAVREVSGKAASFCNYAKPPLDAFHLSTAPSGRSVSGKKARQGPTDSWLLYTKTASRPLTNALLRHAWWESFAACLGPAALGFMEVFCPVVLQLEAMAGGVQVLGPALKAAATVAPAALGCSTGASVQGKQRTHRKRSRSAAGAPPDHCGETRDVSRSRPSKQRRFQAVEELPSVREKSCVSSRPSVAYGSDRCERKRWFTEQDRGETASCCPLWEASLLRNDAPRSRLFNARAAECESIAGDSPAPLPAGFLEAHWLRRHPRGLLRTLRAALPPRTAYARWTRRRSAHAHQGGNFLHAEIQRDATLAVVPMRHVIHVFRWLVLKPTEASENVTASVPATFDLAGHLQTIVSAVVDQCSRQDLRGAALRHTGYLEERYQRQQMGTEQENVQRLRASLDDVVAYLHTLLVTLQWPAHAGRGGPGSFWGANGDSSARVLNSLLTVVRAWLMAGRRAIFPLSRFLDAVPVGQVPWLAGFYTKGPRTAASKNSSAARHARRQRSQMQQRVWMQFVLFLTQDIFPFLLRGSFTVTWSSKSVHTLLFFPTAVWRRLELRELRRTRICVRKRLSIANANEIASTEEENCPSCTRSEEQTCDTACGADACPPTGCPAAAAALSSPREREGWTRVNTAEALTQRAGDASLFGRSGIDPFCLYAGVRLRPDGGKLRPIAVLRSARVRSLTAMARGTPNPFSYGGAILRLLDRIDGTSTTSASSTSKTLIAALWRVYQQQVHERCGIQRPYPRCRSAPSRLPHKCALQKVLQCLMCGVEEQRVREGLPRLSNLSHQDEYAELRSFCEEVRADSCHRDIGSFPTSEESTSPTRGVSRLTLVRCDASRCYDNLPQARVLDAVLSLVRHELYRVLRFTSLLEVRKESSCTQYSQLRRCTLVRTLPCDEVERGFLARIPRGSILWEEEDPESGRGAGPLRSDHPLSNDSSVIAGEAVRSLLREHVQRHLVSLRGHLYEQGVGIVQGSPVAMLLCDRLFADVVDAELSRILAEHSERSLMLRRVDDVLIATMSPVAAQRCFEAMRQGWPSVGYRCNPHKLIASSERGHVVPWCGLLLDDTSLEVSVEWRRIVPLLASLRVGDPRLVHRGDREPTYFTQRFLRALQLRMPPTVLCSRINSHSRLIQTFYEVGLLWSRVVLEEVQSALLTARVRSVAVLMLRPLAVCVNHLWRLRCRHHRFLEARQSGCELLAVEIRACVLTALHRTLQTKLRLLFARTITALYAQRRPRRVLPILPSRGKQHEVHKAEVTSSKRKLKNRQRHHGHHHTPQHCLRSFWWMVAAHVENQQRGALLALKQGTGCVRNAAVIPHGPPSSSSPAPAKTHALLIATGPTSIHARALAATKLV